MQNFLMQIVLAARGDKNNKGENFIQILVFVVMAAFWIIGGIAKARGNKIKDSDFPEEESEEQESPKPIVRQHIQRFVKREVAKPVQKSGIGEKPSGFPRLSNLGLRESAVKTDKLPKIGDVKEVVVKSRAAELFGGLHKANELKRAILYAEILGKPLALRKNSESTF